MNLTILDERTLTAPDFARLIKLHGGHLPQGLADLLAEAEIVPSREVGADVITMYSQAELVDVHTRRRQKLTVCYPGEAEPAAGFVSVLSPVGMSLLGLRAGSVARWRTPSGEACAADVSAILFQPESSGDYST